MKAYVLHGVNELQLEEVDRPCISEHEVLVKVQVAGICGSDIPRIYKTGAHIHPLIPGHEFAGKVIEIGGKVNTKWLHKRVGVFPLIPCRECIPCKNKQYEMCRNYNYLGSRRDGGFAEYVAVPEANLIALQDQVSYEEAAMLEPMAVAVHAIRMMEIDQHCHVAVYGLGTIGLLLTMFLKQMGINNIYVIGNKQFQKENVLSLGIDREHYCDSTKVNVEKWILDKTNHNGVDVFFECIGKNETVEHVISLAAPAGQVMLVGNPYSDMNLKKEIYWKILRNQLTVKGTWNSSFTGDNNDDWHYVLRLLEEKKIEPKKLISHKLSLEDLEEGLHIMRDKTEDYVKIEMQI